MAEDGPARRCRRLDRFDSLIRHAGLSLQPPIAALAMTVRLSAPFALLIPAVGFAPLLAPDLLPA